MLRLFKVKIFVKRGVPYNLDYHQGAFLEPTTEPLLWPAAGVPWSVFQQLFRFDKLAVGFSLEKKILPNVINSTRRHSTVQCYNKDACLPWQPCGGRGRMEVTHTALVSRLFNVCLLKITCSVIYLNITARKASFIRLSLCLKGT